MLPIVDKPCECCVDGFVIAVNVVLNGVIVVNVVLNVVNVVLIVVIVVNVVLIVVIVVVDCCIICNANCE